MIKIGRTHMQDATPMTAGQEFSAFAHQMRSCTKRITAALTGVYELAQGGTAVGTGLNTFVGFAEQIAAELEKDLGIPFVTAPNKFEALATNDALVHFSGALNTTAVSLIKVANDIRLLGSGPRCGLGELRLPANEPGSSIMPGKVNPTQCEALSMICAEVIGNHTAVTVASTHGHLQLNVFRPLVIFNVIRSVRLLSDGCRSFANFCVSGLACVEARMGSFVSRSLMLVTGLAPAVGYDAATVMAQTAANEDKTIRQVAMESGRLVEQDIDRALAVQNFLKPANITAANKRKAGAT
eukprot:GHVT01047734.1.p1 GENE.GHVT01047734.1~~GHVT01047734.1.p1  ORF type:complete len:297 (+),score=54.21 GHVT01047734.1:2771-3661(+)